MVSAVFSWSIEMAMPRNSRLWAVSLAKDPLFGLSWDHFHDTSIQSPEFWPPVSLGRVSNFLTTHWNGDAAKTPSLGEIQTRRPPFSVLT